MEENRALKKEKRDKGARALGKAVGEHSGREKVAPSAKRRKEEREYPTASGGDESDEETMLEGTLVGTKALLTQRETIQALVERAMKGVKEKEAPEKGT